MEHSAMRNGVPQQIDHVPPLLEALREGTRAAHARIEALPGLSVLLSPDLNAGAYITAIADLYRFRLAMDRVLARHLGVVPPAARPDQACLAALAADLAWFGVSLPKPAPGRLAIGADPAILGALYVVEGSSLGGRVIGRAVAQSLGVRPGQGGSFFCGTTADAARQRWQAFCAVLRDAGASLDPTDTLRVVAAATATFGYLEKTLCRPACGRTGRAGGVRAVPPVALANSDASARTMN